MARLDKDAIRKEKEERSGGANFVPKEGEYVLYLAPACREEDSKNYLPLIIHYGLGGKGIPALCLDAERKGNEFLLDPRVVEWVQEHKDFNLKKEAKGGCPVCAQVSELMQDDPDSEAGKNMRAASRFVMGVVPIKYKAPGAADWTLLTPKFQVWNMSYTQWDKITDFIGEVGDPDDPQAAIFLRVKRVGTKKFDTKYSFSADLNSFKAPVKLGKEFQAIVKQAQVPGGAGDLYKVVGDLAKTKAELSALLSGVEVEEVAAEAESEGKGEDSPCYGQLYDGDEDECANCRVAKKCAKKFAASANSDDDDDADDAPPPKAAPKAKKPAPLVEDDDDDADEDDDDDADEAPPAPKRQASTTKPANDPALDELDQALADRAKRKKAGK